MAYAVFAQFLGLEVTALLENTAFELWTLSPLDTAAQINFDLQTPHVYSAASATNNAHEHLWSVVPAAKSQSHLWKPFRSIAPVTNHTWSNTSHATHALLNQHFMSCQTSNIQKNVSFCSTCQRCGHIVNGCGWLRRVADGCSRQSDLDTHTHTTRMDLWIDPAGTESWNMQLDCLLDCLLGLLA